MKQNINLKHLKGLVTEEKYKYYENLYFDLLAKRSKIWEDLTIPIDRIFNKFNILKIENINLLKEQEVNLDIKERFFYKSLIYSFIGGSKNKTKRRIKKIKIKII